MQPAYNLSCTAHTCKNLTSCSKSANKPSTSCVRTACPKLSASLEQVVNNVVTFCDNLVDIIRLVARFFQQIWHMQSWYNNIVTTMCCQPCKILVLSWLYQTGQNNLVTSLIMPSSLLQVVNGLFQQLGTSSATNTTCRHGLWTDL
jgi:hypothetical protein